MQILRAPRILLAAVCVAAGLAGGLVAAERSSASMATAATSLLSSLSPEQRQKATFAFESDERTHWHFIPADAFPRKGLTLKEMNEAQRERVRGLLKAGLSQRGYLTATQIMDLETLLGRDRAAQPDERQRCGEHGAGPRAVFRLHLRDAVEHGHLGLAGRGPPRVAPVHDRQRHAGRQLAVLLRVEPGRGAGRAAGRPPHPRAERRHGARARDRPRRRPAGQGRHRERRA